MTAEWNILKHGSSLQGETFMVTLNGVIILTATRKSKTKNKKQKKKKKKKKKKKEGE